MAFTRQASRATGYFSNPDLGLFLPFQLNPREISNEKETNYNVRQVPGLDESVITYISGGEYTLSFQLIFDTRPVKLRSSSLSSSNPDRGARFLPGAAGPTARSVVPGSGQVNSVGSTVAALAGNKGGSSSKDYTSLPPEDFLTIDGQSYNPELGCLPHIAIIHSFLRPANFDVQARSEELRKLGSLSDTISRVKRLLNSSTSKRFVAPPDCIFHYGKRVFRTKLFSASINEIIHNDKLVPMRITVDCQLKVIESGSFHESNQANRIGMALSFSENLETSFSGNEGGSQTQQSVSITP